MSAHKSSSLAALILVSLLTTTLAQDDDPSRDRETVTPNGSSTTLDIDSARAVFRAVRIFEMRYGYTITYEDPSYVYSDDITDATSYVRRDHRAAGPKVRKIMLPRASKLSMQIPTASCISPSEMTSLLQQLVALQGSGPRGGHFRMEQTESASVFHVIPTEIRDGNGNWAPQTSPLDARISFPAEPRTESELLGTIVNAISVAAHVHVGSLIGGGIVIGIPERHPYELNIGADDETAREVLTRMLQEEPRRQSWALMDSVEMGGNQYLLNITDMPLQPACQTPPAVAPTPKTRSAPDCMDCSGPPGH